MCSWKLPPVPAGLSWQEEKENTEKVEKSCFIKDIKLWMPKHQKWSRPGLGSEQASLAEVGPAHVRGVVNRWSWRLFPTQTHLWLYDPLLFAPGIVPDADPHSNSHEKITSFWKDGFPTSSQIERLKDKIYDLKEKQFQDTGHFCPVHLFFHMSKYLCPSHILLLSFFYA